MIRFADRKDTIKLIKQSSDFNKRRYGSILKWTAYFILAIAFAIALNVNRTLYDVYSGVDMVLASDVLLTILFMATIASVVICYLLIAIKRLQYLLNAVEFQSALLSSAARSNTKFLMILSPQGDIVYADRDAMSIFSDSHLHDINDFLESSIVSDADKGTIRNAIATSVAHNFSVIYKDKKNQQSTTMMVIAPLDKPKGYFLIKG